MAAGAKNDAAGTCVRVGFYLPLGVFAVNSGSKQNVSSGLPAAGLNGGWSSRL